jgi:hypothetical protein
MKDNFTIIDAYLSGQLSAEEKAAVEARLATDPALAEELRRQKLEHEALELLLERDLRQKMAVWADTKPEIEAQKGSNLMRILGVVGMIALLTGGIFWLRQDPAPSSQERHQPNLPAPAPDTVVEPVAAVKPVQPTLDPDSRLIALAVRSYNDEPIRSQLRAGRTSPDSLQDWYIQGQYNRLVTALAGLDDNEVNYLRQLELRAHAFFHLKKYGRAVQDFTNIVNSQKEPFAERSDWYLLLAAAAQGRAGKAVFQQQKAKILSDKEHSFYKYVKALPNDL